MRCDPSDASTCSGGRGCYLFPTSAVPSGTTAWATLCLTPGSSADGGACSTFNGCVANHMCAAGRCVQSCVFPTGTTCPRGACQMLVGRPTIGGIEYGVCP